MRTEVNEVEDAGVAIEQEVAPVWVGLHEAPLEQLLQRKLQQQRAHRVPHLLRHLRHLHASRMLRLVQLGVDGECPCREGCSSMGTTCTLAWQAQSPKDAVWLDSIDNFFSIDWQEGMRHTRH